MNDLLKSRAWAMPFFLCVALNLINWAYLAWRSNFFTGHVILHYTVHLGIDALGPAWQLLYLPFVGLILLIINLLIIVKHRYSWLVAVVLIYTTILLEVLLLLFSVLLILVNS